MIVIKVSVPTTNDIWRLKVPENISFRAFRAKVELKVGFAAIFMEKESAGRRIVSEEAFRRWVAGRVRNGRNHPLVVQKKTEPLHTDYPSGQTPSPQSPPADPRRWAPVDGMIVIKVSVPTTNDIWRLKVPENISFRAFRAKVELKVGFAAIFMEKESAGRRIVSEEAFRRWVAGRVRNGRNHPLVVQKKQSPFILTIHRARRHPRSRLPPTPADGPQSMG